MNLSRLFVIGSGLFSVVVFLFCSLAHGILIGGALYYRSSYALSEFISRFNDPAITVLFIAICIPGAILCIIFLVHAFRNPCISRRHRLLWIPAIAWGYGLIFYWYLHVLHQNRGTIELHEPKRTAL
jgi:hypothetical protein